MTLRLALNPMPEEEKVLERTVQLFSEGCNYALKVAKENKTFNKFKLHHIVYKDLRNLGLKADSATEVINTICRKKGHKVKTYKANFARLKKKQVSLRKDQGIVTISTAEERLKLPIKIGPYHEEILSKSESVQGGILKKDKKGRWYLYLHIRIKLPEIKEETGRIIGLDLGQNNIVTLSNVIQIKGGEIKTKRIHYLKKRAEVQSKLDKPSKRTKGVKKLWARLSGRERRFVEHTLHTISRRIIDSLQPGDILAIEDLKGIRGRTTKRGRQERHLHNLWPYHRLRFMLEYKAALKGIKVIAVDPKHTSQECPRCGHVDRRNRKTQSLFRCVECGFQHNADWVAAYNIAQRAGSKGKGCFKPARMLRVSSIHRITSASLPDGDAAWGKLIR